MKFDKPLIAGFIGALSTVPAELTTQVLVFLGFGKYSVYQLDSLIITFNRPTEFIGLFVHFVIGGFIGVIFYYALEKIGQDYLIIKSTAFSVIFWTLAEMFFTAFIEGRFFDLRPINDYYTHMLGTFAFGITLGLLFNRYLFNKSIPVKNK